MSKKKKEQMIIKEIQRSIKANKFKEDLTINDKDVYDFTTFNENMINNNLNNLKEEIRKIRNLL